MKQSISSLTTIVNQLTPLKNQSSNIKKHSHRVCQLASSFGKYLELSEHAIHKLIIGGLIHDIGKISYGDHLIEGRASIDKHDKTIIQNHTIVGLSLITDHIVDSDIREIVLYHHERIDGKGYPFGLIGNEIPYLVRVFTIIDAYDAMTSSRGYNQPLTIDEAIKEINGCSNTQFDQALAKDFICFLNEKFLNNSTITS